MELVSIATPTTPLDGLFYQPPGPARGAAILFHGNTMNFYNGALRFLPPVLLDLGLAVLAFNRRGHDILSIRNSRSAEGAAFQTTAEGVEDNRIAAHWLAGRGFPAPFVIGHSNGGMLAVPHVLAHPQTPGLVLLSAHRGGHGPGLLAGFAATGHLAQDAAEATLGTARAMVAAGQGDTLLLLPGWWYAISAASYVDRMTTMPDIVALAPQVACPSLFIRGDLESAEAYPVDAFAAASGGPCEAVVLEGCDHFYNDREPAVCAQVQFWLAARI